LQQQLCGRTYDCKVKFRFTETATWPEGGSPERHFGGFPDMDFVRVY